MKTDNYTKRLLKFGIPSMVSFAFMNIYMLLNMKWLSNIGKEAIAAMTLFNSTLFIFNAVNELAGASSMPLISKYSGKKDKESTSSVISQSFQLKIFSGMITSILGIITIPFILGFISENPSLITPAMEYGIPVTIIIPFSFLKYSILTAFRSIQRPLIAMYLLICESVIAIICDSLIINGNFGFPEAGLSGVGISLVSAQMFTIFCGLFILNRGIDGFKINIFSFKGFSSEYKRYIFKAGFPGMINSIFFSLSLPFVINRISLFGKEALATYGAVFQITSSLVTVIMGLTLGSGTLIGILTGENDITGIRKITGKMIYFCLLFYSLPVMLIFFMPQIVLSIYLSDISTEFVDISLKMIRILSFIIILESLKTCLMSFFGATGHTRINLRINIISNWIILIPGLFLAGLITNNIFLSLYIILFSRIAANTMLLNVYRKDLWLKEL